MVKHIMLDKAICYFECFNQHFDIWDITDLDSIYRIYDEDILVEVINEMINLAKANHFKTIRIPEWRYDCTPKVFDQFDFIPQDTLHTYYAKEL